jgi:guanosine-3',5'-bis(diphosphate) 3'-pyrophosphohydrolase
MKKYMIPLVSSLLVGASLFATDVKPKVSLCNSEECETVEGVRATLQETRKKISSLAHEDKTVLKNYDVFAEVLSNSYQKEKSITAKEVAEITTALEFAAEKHRLQTRKDAQKTPYISHPIGVAFNLMSAGEVRDAAVIIGALLHDTVEDTETTFEEIEEKFGKQVVGYVRELTDDRSLAQDARKRMQVINAAHKSKGAAQIKLADKLYNLRDLLNNPPKDWTQMRVDRYYEWAQSVVDRLPKANDKLYQAVEGVINTYWEKQEPSKG